MKKAINYLVVMWLIVASGNPAVTTVAGDLPVLLLFAITLVLFVVRQHFISPGSALFLVAVGFVLLAQLALFGSYVLSASLGFFLNVLTAFMLMSVMPRFLDYFVRCMFWLAALSLPFYFMFAAGAEEVLRPLQVYESNLEWNIGIHNFRSFGYETARNSGLFWEPGAFAGYLAFALFVMVLLRERVGQSVLVGAVIFIALLTTKSTTGYLALLVVIFAYILQRSRRGNPVILAILLPVITGVVLWGSWQVAQQVPFLHDKIVEQFEEVETGEERAEINRIGNAIYDWEFVQLRPFLGWSANVETRTSVDPTAMDFIQAQGNALSGDMVRFGIIGWLLFMSRWLFSFKKASRSWLQGLAGVAAIAIMLTGEKYTNFPLVMTLFFLERHHVHPEDLVVHRKRRRDGSLLNNALVGLKKSVGRGKRRGGGARRRGGRSGSSALASRRST